MINFSVFLGSISDMQRWKEQEQSEEEMDRKRKKKLINPLNSCRAEVIYLISAKDCVYGEKMWKILSPSSYTGLCHH